MLGDPRTRLDDRLSTAVDEVITTVLPGGRIRLRSVELDLELHPLWIRERSRERSAIDPANGQRLFEPTTLDVGLGVERCDVAVISGQRSLVLQFTDGHQMSLSLADIASATSNREPSSEVPPASIPWVAGEISVPVIDHRRLDGGGTDALDAKHEALTAFFELGFFILSNTPAVPDALHGITAHFGRISPTNFGVLFDVRTEPVPVDLAYTPVALSAHTDQPYRSPTPAIQFLHTITNSAPGGASTVVDGLAAVNALRDHDPEAHALLCSLPVDFRYDIGTDVKILRAPLIELSPDGSLRQFRFSPRLDYPPPADPDTLDVFYRGRRWLSEALNDPVRQLEYPMSAGQVLVVDNHRVLHGRTSFDPTKGDRHLQGCYIDHDGPVTEWILNDRARNQGIA